MSSVRLPVFLTVVALSAAWALGAFTRSSSAADGLWQTDFKAALTQAKQEKKHLLVDFTGSDWCPWCVRLRKEVFDKQPFQAAAPKQFVLVELDFPQEKELSDDLKKQNKELSEKYNVEGFPTVLVLDADGQVIARTGYREGGPEEYLKQLAEFFKIYENVLALKGKLDTTKGLDRAKLLNEIVEGYQKLGNDSEEVAALGKEIIALDPDNKAGLKAKYALAEVEHLLQQSSTLSRRRKLAEAKAKTAEAQELLGVALAIPGISGEMRQQGYMLKGQLFFSEGKFVDLVATLKLAKEAAPESKMVKEIDDTLARFSSVAEAQETANKLEAELAKSEGLDRAKLLDKLIDAKQKLVMYDRKSGENVKKWTKEIISLDADNKAGLKKKYQFKAVLSDAEALMRAGKSDEAAAAVDKALETAGISGEETQQAQLLKAQLVFMQQHDEEQYAAQLKKALEAAPSSELAPRIEMMLSRFEQHAKKPAPKKPKDE